MITPSDSELFVVDSSGWVEYFGDGPKASAFAPYFEDEQKMVIPTIIIFEVYKKLARERPVQIADQFYSMAQKLRAIDLDAQLAWAASRASLDHHLPMADAIIYASSRAFAAELVTSDTHFRGLPGVTVL